MLFDRTAADITTVEGKLLSDVYPDVYPGSIVWWQNNYKLGKEQGGLEPANPTYTLQQLPIIKACSHYAGGAMFLTYNAEGKTDTHLQFWASQHLDDLQGKGGNCPPVPTPTIVQVWARHSPVYASSSSVHLHIALSYVEFHSIILISRT